MVMAPLDDGQVLHLDDRIINELWMEKVTGVLGWIWQ
jgi:hypothetical protein